MPKKDFEMEALELVIKALSTTTEYGRIAIFGSTGPERRKAENRILSELAKNKFILISKKASSIRIRLIVDIQVIIDHKEEIVLESKEGDGSKSSLFSPPSQRHKSIVQKANAIVPTESVEETGIEVQAEVSSIEEETVGSDETISDRLDSCISAIVEINKWRNDLSAPLLELKNMVVELKKDHEKMKRILHKFQESLLEYP